MKVSCRNGIGNLYKLHECTAKLDVKNNRQLGEEDDIQ